LIVTVSIDNPYQSPEAVIAEKPPTKPAEVSWKSIAKRWEILRLPFNLVVGLAGLLALAMVPRLAWEEMIGGAVAYGLCANVMYLLGPVTEMYFNWLVDAWEDRFVPRWLAGFVRSRYLTALLFVGGCLFSVGLTLMIGLSAAFSAGLADQ
jgi:hypothetical protein